MSSFSPPAPRVMKFLYGAGMAPLLGGLVLLLTTTGRRTGLPRTTPLQYERIGAVYYVASARGTRADWYRNLLASPCVRVRVRDTEFDAFAEPVCDPCRIADFLELRLVRHPRMVGAILRSEGLPPTPSRAELEQYARRLAMVILHPD